jgi:hypothetical protein
VVFSHGSKNGLVAIRTSEHIGTRFFMTESRRNDNRKAGT